MLKTYHGSCHCGAVTFAAETPIGRMYGVNLGCLDDASDEELSKAPIAYVDGRSDNWQSAPEFFAHL